MGFFFSTSVFDSVSLTTVNGPAPTGLILNACSPIFLSAVREAIQFRLATNNWFWNAPSGAAKLIFTVVASGAVIDLTGGRTGLHVHGAARSRFQLATTAAPSSGVPSENFRFGRIAIVQVLPPSEGVADVARSAISFPPSAIWNSCPKIEFI